MHPGRSDEGEGQAYETADVHHSTRSSANRARQRMRRPHYRGRLGPDSTGGSGSANGADLKGTWRGSFEGVNTGDSGRIHGDIVCQINDDGTYKTTWVTRPVAGSTRGGADLKCRALS